MSRVRLWAAGVIAVLLLIVLFQNLEPTRLSVLLWSWEVRLIMIMAVCAALGALLGALVVLALSARRGSK